LANQEETEV